MTSQSPDSEDVLHVVEDNMEIVHYTKKDQRINVIILIVVAANFVTVLAQLLWGIV